MHFLLKLKKQIFLNACKFANKNHKLVSYNIRCRNGGSWHRNLACVARQPPFYLIKVLLRVLVALEKVNVLPPCFNIEIFTSLLYHFITFLRVRFNLPLALACSVFKMEVNGTGVSLPRMLQAVAHRNCLPTELPLQTSDLS